MTDIRNAKRGDNVRWIRFGRWSHGQIMDVMPPMNKGESVRGFIIDCGGKCIPLSIETLINCQAIASPRGCGE
jgi:hypothetical protein